MNKFILYSLLFLSSISCRKLENPFSSAVNKRNTLLQNAVALVNSNPDSTIKITGQLLYATDSLLLNEQFQLKTLQLRKTAFSNINKIDSQLICGENIRILAATIPDSLAIAESLIDLYSNVDVKYIKRAKRFLPGGISTFHKTGKLYEAGLLTALYGVSLSNEGKFPEAQRNLLAAYDIFLKLDSTKALAKICNSLGINYDIIGSKVESKNYYIKAINYVKQLNEPKLYATILMNLGINQRKTNKDTTISLYRQAIELLTLAKEDNILMKVKYNLANLYYLDHDFDKALNMFDTIFIHAKEKKYQEGVVMASCGIGNVYAAKQQYPKSIQYYEDALATVENNNQKSLLLVLLPEMISAYKLNGNIDKAFKYSEQLRILKDSILSVEKTNTQIELEKQFQTEKKEQEINRLKKESNYRLIIIVGLIVSVLIFFILWRQRNQLFHERDNSYNVLMSLYRKEKAKRLQIEHQRETAVTDDLIRGEERTSDKLFDQLNNYFVEEKPYLDSKLKQDDVLNKMEINYKTLSQLLRDRNFENFTAFLNYYRVNEAKLLMEQPEHINLKMNAIAEMAGFGTRQSFYNAFEFYTGVKPAYYRLKIQLKS